MEKRNKSIQSSNDEIIIMVYQGGIMRLKENPPTGQGPFTNRLLLCQIPSEVCGADLPSAANFNQL